MVAHEQSNNQVLYRSVPGVGAGQNWGSKLFVVGANGGGQSRCGESGGHVVNVVDPLERTLFRVGLV